VNTSVDIVSPIFVVGAPRSGTTLLAGLFGAHTAIDCGPETQFFSKLSGENLVTAVADRNWPRKAVALVCELTLAGQKVVDLFDMSADAVEAYLSERVPSVGAMLESLTVTRAARFGKVRWAEKTPNHILHLERIRIEYPEAYIVRIVRDPRDVAQSMCNLPWASRSALANAELWNEWHEASRTFFVSDGRTCTIRQEDLALKPAEVLSNVCEFVGVPFEPTMIQDGSARAGVTSPNEPWKRSALEPIDASRIFAWKRMPSNRLADAISIHCSEGILEFGYEPGVTPARMLTAYQLDVSAVETHEAALVTAAVNGVGVTRTNDWLGADLLLVVAPPPVLRARALLRRLKRTAILMGRRLTGRMNVSSTNPSAFERLVCRKPASADWWSEPPG
jgi:sulfotransferase family protein